MQKLYSTILQVRDGFINNFDFTSKIILILVAIHIINMLLQRRLLILGIIPRNPLGVLGILFAPLLHGDFNHLFLNAIPLYFMMNFALMILPFPMFVHVSLLITIISGVLIWLFARPGLHVGASALITGYFGFLLSTAYLKPSFIMILLAFACLYYFFGIVVSLFPQKERTSWEGHIFGLAAGIITAQIYTQVPMFVTGF